MQTEFLAAMQDQKDETHTLRMGGIEVPEDYTELQTSPRLPTSCLVLQKKEIISIFLKTLSYYILVLCEANWYIFFKYLSTIHTEQKR